MVHQHGSSIGSITTGGVVTNYTGTGISNPDAITAGPDGALWFTNYGNDSIGRITTGGVVTNYTGTGISNPQGITAGPDGALWVTNGGNSIGRITTGGVVTNYTGTGISSPTRDHRRSGRRLVVHQLRQRLHRAYHYRGLPSADDEHPHPFEWGDAIGIATLDASASNATGVEFRLFGGIYGYDAPVICTATPTYLRLALQLEHHDGPQWDLHLGIVGHRRDGAAAAGVSITVANPPPRAFSSLPTARRSLVHLP